MINASIDGGPLKRSGSYGVINPATGKIAAEAPDCSSAELDAAMSAAARSFPAWERSEEQRRASLSRAADIVDAHAEELARLVTLEQGKPLAGALREVKGAAGRFRYAAGLEVRTDVVHDQEGLRVEVVRRPYGVVAAITPWNYPVIVAAGKLAAAVRVGNTVVLKPSPFTPLATLRMGELLQDAFPPGVVNVISGGDELGKSMIVHPMVRKVSFTGSTEAGRHILGATAADFKRATLELGGNDAAIVLDDVDPQVIAPKLFWGAFQNAGQVCSTIKRLYVHERIHSQLLGELARIASAVRVGDGLDPTTEMGPVSTEPQLRRIEELLIDATRCGGRVRAGGKRLPGSGYFHTPTIVEGLADDARLVAEEQFGPALPVMSFATEEEAIGRANATHFGLSGSVWSGNVARARALGARLQCGTVWINQHLMVLAGAPIAGHKWSGVGVEGGLTGLLDFTQVQSVFVPTGA